MKEEFEDVARFVRYHLDRGIDDILIFYDDQDAGELRAYLREEVSSGGYTVFALDDFDSMRPHLAHPRVFETIQNAVHQLACKVARYPWVITLDADEFLHAPSLDAAFFEGIPDQVLSVRFPVAEAVWLPADDAWRPFGSSGFRKPLRFRRPRKLPGALRKLIPRIVYRDDARFFPDNVAGHGQGKHIFRRDIHFDFIGPHHAEIDTRDVSVSVMELSVIPIDIDILHYDAIGFDRWREKIARRTSGQICSQGMRPERRRLLEAFAACSGDDEAETLENQKALFLRLYCLNWRQYILLRLFRSGFRASPFY